MIGPVIAAIGPANPYKPGVGWQNALLHRE
ncbi:hypothetical protein Spla01_04926 [Streptomyces platensis]|uniref:Uncharacterized protein n=1 Tax=Streptomyces platensis TaxID=58346 RepID=A0ABX3XPN6_STRPT|nr:hypothetical protein BG653_05924 [Streptomyces platensis]